MDNKTPDNFWNDELVKEFVEGAIRVQDSMPHEVSLDLGILHFKKSKEHKVEEKRAEILDFRKMPDNKVELHSMYCFALRGFIPQEKYEAVKQAIERELNNDTVVEDKIDIDWSPKPVTEKYYTQSEVDAIRKEAFYAGRGRYVNQSNGETLYDYPTIQDYISSSKQPNNEPLSDSIPTLEERFSKLYDTRETYKHTDIPLTEQPKQVEKPPLGLIPKHIWEEQRIWDIAEAIERYQKAGKEIPKEWLAEDKILRKK